MSWFEKKKDAEDPKDATRPFWRRGAKTPSTEPSGSTGSDTSSSHTGRSESTPTRTAVSPKRRELKNRDRHRESSHASTEHATETDKQSPKTHNPSTDADTEDPSAPHSVAPPTSWGGIVASTREQRGLRPPRAAREGTQRKAKTDGESFVESTPVSAPVAKRSGTMLRAPSTVKREMGNRYTLEAAEEQERLRMEADRARSRVQGDVPSVAASGFASPSLASSASDAVGEHPDSTASALSEEAKKAKGRPGPRLGIPLATASEDPFPLSASQEQRVPDRMPIAQEPLESQKTLEASAAAESARESMESPNRSVDKDDQEADQAPWDRSQPAMEKKTSPRAGLDTSLESTPEADATQEGEEQDEVHEFEVDGPSAQEPTTHPIDSMEENESTHDEPLRETDRVPAEPSIPSMDRMGSTQKERATFDPAIDWETQTPTRGLKDSMPTRAQDDALSVRQGEESADPVAPERAVSPHEGNAFASSASPELLSSSSIREEGGDRRQDRSIDPKEPPERASSQEFLATLPSWERESNAPPESERKESHREEPKPLAPSVRSTQTQSVDQGGLATTASRSSNTVDRERNAASARNLSVVVQSMLDEAALAFAGERESQARGLLQDTIEMSGAPERAWLMLLDLLEVQGEQQEYEHWAQLFSEAFGVLPPPFSAKRTTKNGIRDSGVLIVSGVAQDVDWAGATRELLASGPSGATIDLARINPDRLPANVASGLLQLMRALRKKRHPTQLMGEGKLSAWLSEKVRESRKKEVPDHDDQPYWLLLLEVFQWRSLNDPFDELSLEFSLWFELSGPGWAAGGEAPPAPPRRHQSESLKLEPDEELGEVELRRLHDRIEERWEQGQDAVVDFSGVRRMAFAAAGAWLRALAQQPARRVRLENPNALVQALLDIVGITPLVELVARKR